MIGTKVTVGFDAKAMQAGLSQISKSMKGLGAVWRGGLESLGGRMTGFLGQVITAIPSAVDELLTYAGDVNDLSQSLGVPLDKLMQIQEAMRMGGAGVDSLRMFFTMARNLEDANEKGGDLADSIHRLGLNTDDLAKLRPDKQLEAIAVAAAKSELPIGKLAVILSDIFSARIGPKMIKMFQEFNKSMPQAESNIKGFSEYMMKSAEGLDEMGDALGRWTTLRRGLASVLVSAFADVFGTGSIDKVFDKLNPSGLRQWFGDAIRGAMGELGKLKTLGLGEYIKQALMPAFDWIWNKAVSLIDMLRDKLNTMFLSVIGTLTMELTALWLKVSAKIDDMKAKSPGLLDMILKGSPGLPQVKVSANSGNDMKELIALTRRIERNFSNLATV